MRYSGDTTHDALQEGAAAILVYEGSGAAWVTTVDDSTTLAQVVCDEQRNPQGNWIPCVEVNTDDPDPGISGRHQRVAWSSRWGHGAVNQRHVVRVISDDTHDVDVAAFLIVHGA